MEQRTLKIGDRVIYCYEDGSVEYFSSSRKYAKHPLVRTFGSNRDRRGYKKITITVDGEQKTLSIHRLIAMAFHPNPEGLPEVDHINRNKTDNRSCNLRWCDSDTNNVNRVCVDQSITKHSAKNKLTMRKPDGSQAKTKALPPEVYSMLKPLSQKERYIKHQDLQKD